jgi:hypothetical protein
VITALRHLLAIAILPFTVTVAVPVWIARRYEVTLAVASSAAALALQLAGLVVLGAGFALFVACVARFAAEGQGTLAPWDPPRRFVVRGPYRFVRNPMISGVILRDEPRLPPALRGAAAPASLRPAVRRVLPARAAIRSAAAAVAPGRGVMRRLSAPPTPAPRP